MSDPIADRYRDRQQQASDARHLKEREDEALRTQLIADIPGQIEGAFSRLEATEYRDEVVRGSLRRLELNDGSIHEVAAWFVGRSEYWYLTYEDQEYDSFFLTSRRTIAHTVDVGHREGAPLKLLNIESLTVNEARSLIGGLRKVGLTRAEMALLPQNDGIRWMPAGMVPGAQKRSRSS